ncbi:hypothetical protein DSM106972_081390 [Dulcicalothrix desertica PCC 7102]|uniref:O-antigen polymerase n=1 Tax=Dulcicalothrix desertica PCC 7102 TaxID=232991 RepID=A0A3S1ASP1_9CYAN|nr:hypothetical protein [Dulcicalothrix desertica]RUS98510.1 hypothetical protein DSM106972_081390 [Dulcicalothrix desertica PCC 7102]TWH54914.1 hypothetical protein CAL7102_03001 [Dulcicalothrix desertica PCC 7102]
MIHDSLQLPIANSNKKGLIYYCMWVWSLLITASVVLSPRLGESGFLKYIRIDDILFPVTAAATLVLLYSLRPIKKIIVAFLYLYSFNAIVLLVTHSSGLNNVTLLEKSLPFLKNIQYLIYFCFVFTFAYRISNLKNYQQVITSIFLCFIPNLFYGLFQVSTFNFSGYYGLGILNEISPTLAGSVFYFSIIICNLIALIEPKGSIKCFWAFLGIVNFIFVALAGSRGAFLASIAYYVILISHQIVNIRTLIKPFGKTILSVIILFSLVCFTFLVIIPSFNTGYGGINEILNQLPNRYLELNPTNIEGEARLDNWTNVLSMYAGTVNSFPLLALFGLGSGGTYEIFGVLMNAADSQFVYVIVTGGLIGFLLYLNALSKLYAFKKHKIPNNFLGLKQTFISLFWSFIVFSISQEVFNLSKTGGLFWIMSGLLLGVICKQTKLNQTFPII